MCSSRVDRFFSGMLDVYKRQPLNKAQWKTGKVQFKIGDAETGIKDYKVKIDGEFADVYKRQL